MPGDHASSLIRSSVNAGLTRCWQSPASGIWPSRREAATDLSIRIPAPDSCYLRDSGSGSVKSRRSRSDAVGALDGFWLTRTMTEQEQARTSELEQRRGERLLFSVPVRSQASGQPTGVVGRQSGSASGSVGVAAESAARAARRVALKTYRKFSQTDRSLRCPIPVDA